MSQPPERCYRFLITSEIGEKWIGASMVHRITMALYPYGEHVTELCSAAVGYQAVSSDGKTEQPNAVLEALIAVVRPTGGLGIPGLYVPKDPGAPDSNSAK